MNLAGYGLWSTKIQFNNTTSALPLRATILPTKPALWSSENSWRDCTQGLYDYVCQMTRMLFRTWFSQVQYTPVVGNSGLQAKHARFLTRITVRTLNILKMHQGRRLLSIGGSGSGESWMLAEVGGERRDAELLPKTTPGLPTRDPYECDKIRWERS